MIVDNNATAAAKNTVREAVNTVSSNTAHPDKVSGTDGAAVIHSDAVVGIIGNKGIEFNLNVHLLQEVKCFF